MTKFVSTLAPRWSRCLQLLQSRSYGSEIKGSWNDAPVCDGYKITKSNKKKCHPKEGSCSTNLCACPPYEWPKCDEPDIKIPSHLSCCCDHRLTEQPCKESNKKPPKKEQKQPFKSMWEESGIEKQCPDFHPRLDDTHYVSTNKSKRIYTQTWETCKPMIKKRKFCCIHEVCLLPPLKKRPKQECPHTAKEQDSEQLKVDFNVLKKCLENVVENPNTKRINKCRKVVMPCCRTVSKSTKCHRNRDQSKCVKECCPHPSFSECETLNSRPQPPPEECQCSRFPSRCETSRFLVRKHIFQLPPPLPAWPPKERPK